MSSTLVTEYLPAPSTLAIFGMPLSAKHDGYRNKRALQDAVRAGKEKEAPARLQWNGNLNKLFAPTSNSPVNHSRCR